MKDPENLYSDAEPTPVPADQTAPDMEEQTEETPAEEQEEGPAPSVGLLPKEFFGGEDVQPGKEYMIKVVSVRDGEVQVQREDMAEEASEPKAEAEAEGHGDLELRGMME